jgi:hypothetical protein
MSVEIKALAECSLHTPVEWELSVQDLNPCIIVDIFGDLLLVRLVRSNCAGFIEIASETRYGTNALASWDANPSF